MVAWDSRAVVACVAITARFQFGMPPTRLAHLAMRAVAFVAIQVRIKGFLFGTFFIWFVKCVVLLFLSRTKPEQKCDDQNTAPEIIIHNLSPKVSE